METPVQIDVYEELRNAELLWHYTSWEGLYGMVEKNEIWASNIGYLNDTLEYQKGVETLEALIRQSVLADLVSEFAPQFKRNAENYFAISFSGHFDQLSQWRGYSGATGGFAVGFDREALNALVEPLGAKLGRCYYVGKEANVPSGLKDEFGILRDEVHRRWEDTKQPDASLRKAQMLFSFALRSTSFPELAVRIKDDSFESEREERLTLMRVAGKTPLGFHTKASLVVPHLEVKLNKKPDRSSAEWLTDATVNPIRAILVGPTVHTDLIKRSVEMLVEDKWRGALIKVATSKVPFRNW